MKQVLIIKKYDRRFRMPLYKAMQEQLLKNKIKLVIAYGKPDKYEIENINDYIVDEISAGGLGFPIKNIHISLGRKIISYQPVLNEVNKYDLVIFQQSNTQIINFILILFKKIRIIKPILAFWGHGKNFNQPNEKSFESKVKNFYSTLVDHWFAYTELSKLHLSNIGFPDQQVTVLNNSIDIKSISEQINKIDEVNLNSFRESNNIMKNDVVGIFCGSIYKNKGIDFLINSILSVKKVVQNFKFIFVGEGSYSGVVIDFVSQNNDWVSFLGYQEGDLKTKAFMVSDFLCIPSFVGLNIIDSFVYESPLITTNAIGHGPEIAYLENGVNGLNTDLDIVKYSDAIIKLCHNQYQLEKLKQGCIESKKKYSIEMMAENYCTGILKCLK